MEVRPPSLGESLIRAQCLHNIGILQQKGICLSIIELLLKVHENPKAAAKFISVCTFHGKKECLDAEAIHDRAEFLRKSLTEQEMATLILSILTLDKTDVLIEQLGIAAEQNKQRRINDIKNLEGTNVVHTGGVSLYGSLIGAACEKFGWTYDECVWGISYSNLRLMLADAVNTTILNDKQRRMASIPAAGEEIIDAGDRANLEKLTKEYLKKNG